MDPDRGGDLRLDPVGLARAARRLLDAAVPVERADTATVVPPPDSLGDRPAGASVAMAAAGAGAALQRLLDGVAEVLIVDADRLILVGVATTAADTRARTRLAGGPR
ncbi:hypothetical protein [Luedemannella helvata]|uniref:Uncharacterized protein n=1 Tax=Luedemannella helvata TaxID=349315 RepID=A0ABP4WCB2_9ACTN